jgi:CBS domain-containing protein
MRIQDVLRGKTESGVVTIRPGAAVRELLALLAEHNIGAVIVSDDGTQLDGIVSERDVVRRLGTDERVLDGPVSAIMTRSVRSCASSTPVDDLMQLMTEHRFRHVPVVDDGRLVGIISIGDVVKSRIDQLEFERDQLDNYLHQG